MILQNQAVQFTEKKQAALVPCGWDQAPLAADEIIGRTLVSLISTGSELGAYMDYFGGTKYPVETGYAAILEVLDTGERVANLKPGDRVLALAPHQAYSRVKQDEVILVPAGMKPEHAVIGRFPAVSMTSMIHTRIRPTEPVMVTGLGVVGLMCAQVMQHCGYTVYAFDPNAVRRETARACGLRNVYASPDEVPDLKGRAGLAMECSGREEAAYALIANLRKGGELYLIGVHGTVPQRNLRMICCSVFSMASYRSIPASNGRFRGILVSSSQTAIMAAWPRQWSGFVTVSFRWKEFMASIPRQHAGKCMPPWQTAR